jgi:hypothetical protein
MAASPVELSFGDAGGEYLDYKIDFGVNNNTEGAVRSWLATIEMKAKVDEITDTGIERRFEFGDFTVTTISGGRPEPDPNAGEYSGTTLWLKMDSEGAMEDWKGLDVVRGRTADGKRFKEYIVYQLIAMYQPPTDEAVNAGSTWEKTFETNVVTGSVDAKYTVDLTYTVEGFGVRAGRDAAKIKVDIDILAEGSGRMGGKETWFRSEEEGSGEIWFDHVNGVIIEFATDVTANQETRTERAGKEDVATSYATVDRETKIALVE